MSINYPIKFKPILKETIWGGEKLMTVLNKQSDKKNIGESWEISSVDRNISIVSNGKLKGESLENLLIIYRDALVGKKVFNEFSYKFPLLIKYIDAKEALSIQLHPNDKLAKERHNSFGKTEMWYVMQADEGGDLIVGFKENSNKEEYLEHLQHKSLLEILNVDKVQKGDVYFIPTGRIHAIGAGVMLAEIQQTSDVTYRIYDWDRKDTRGNYRKLHTELALDAIDYKAQEEYKIAYNKTLNNQSNIVDCQYFTTNIISIEGKLEIDHSNKDSFVIYMCVKGEATIHYGEGEVETVSYGETVLMPAILKEFSISSKNDSELLEIYIK
ncbi:MAG: mannose-6-phosphate isomerase [Aureibaculum sp.]|nr:mannose-6-phosphate isomerase [Aureibaculum sp.]